MYYTRQLQMQDQRYRELWGQYERAYALAKQPGVPKFSFDMIARADRDVQVSRIVSEHFRCCSVAYLLHLLA
jgi:hypothetical protein